MKNMKFIVIELSCCCLVVIFRKLNFIASTTKILVLFAKSIDIVKQIKKTDLLAYFY
jgi:hypothetical protein